MNSCIRVATFLAALIGCAAAWSAPYTTSGFDAHYKVEPGGELTVTETISVNFSRPEHFLRRWLPISGQGLQNARRTVAYEVVSAKVKAHGSDSPVEIQATTEGNKWKLAVGNSTMTLAGPVTFEITYRVAGALTTFPAEESAPPRVELYWNALPSQWPTSVSRASISVEGPAPYLKAIVRTGLPNTREGVLISQTKVTGRTDLVKVERMTPHGFKAVLLNGKPLKHGALLVVAFPESSIPGLINDGQSQDFSGTPAGPSTASFQPTNMEMPSVNPLCLVPLLAVLAAAIAK